MIDRKRQFFEKNPVSGALSQEQVAMDDLERELAHGMTVSCLARRLGRELGLSEEEQYQLAVAGLLHDIGKCRLSSYLYGNAQIELNVEKMKYVRTHSRLSYDILKEKGYEEPILEAVRYHHENYDGSGYPDNLAGEDIPYMARILRVCDVFAALTSDRRYRSAFSADTAMELMIEEIKNFDMGIFLAFQRIAHEAGTADPAEHEAVYTGGRGMITQAPRGVQDWYGENMHKRAVVEKIARDLAKTYNMTEIITPMFEPHGAVSARCGRDHRCGTEGDVHLQRQRRPEHYAETGGNRRRHACLSGAQHVCPAGAHQVILCDPGVPL